MFLRTIKWLTKFGIYQHNETIFTKAKNGYMLKSTGKVSRKVEQSHAWNYSKMPLTNRKTQFY